MTTKLAASLSLLLWLTACSGEVAQNQDCARQAPPNSRYRWGYYAGYGCAPVTPFVNAPYG